MEDKKNIAALSKIKSVTIFALFVNMSLFVLKMVVGFLAGSTALVADGIHSLSDMATDFGVILGAHIGAKKPDKTHSYGHGRAETFSALFISLTLALVGVGMIYYAAVEISRGRVVKPRYEILIVAVISVIAKEFLFRITKTIAIEHHSAAAYANAWHHRSDAFSSVAVMIGFIVLKLGYGYGDQLAAIAVGLTILLVALQIITQCFGELAERSVDNQTIEHIENIINSNPQIRQWHKLRTRTVAREIFLDLHILVDKNLSIVQSHNIAEQLEDTLHNELSRPVNITIHIEPDIPELRKQTAF
ncbi:MAG: cation diffusion facilitator family transporter [Phycisphaerae bacterium]|jgi:cation diffusion facilitator family transporter